MSKGKALVTHDYAARNDALPLPATLTIDLGQVDQQREAKRGCRCGCTATIRGSFARTANRPTSSTMERSDGLRENPEEPVYHVRGVPGAAGTPRMPSTRGGCANLAWAVTIRTP